MLPKLNHSNYQPAQDLLKNKTIVISGAGSGIGRQAALTFACHGAQVILLSKTREKLAGLDDEIRALRIPGLVIPEPILCQVDFLKADEGFYETLAEHLEKECGHIDGLLHNASMLGDLCEIANYPAGIWNQVLQVNVNSAFLLSKALIPLMKKAPAASILFTSSSVGRKGRAYWGAYSVSKFAIEGLMQCLAEELENTSKIRVNSLNPGGTQTAMRKAAFPGEDPRTLPAPADIMNSYLFLMGDDSKAVHGQALNVRL